MTILITGVAGFVGSNIARYIREYHHDISLLGIDNLSRRGSEFNLGLLKSIGCKFYHGDVRSMEDVDDLPPVDWVIDCAANPSVLAGLEGSSLRLLNNNLIGSINLLEKCKREHAGFVMLSTSRVYSISDLINIPLRVGNGRFNIDGKYFPKGLSELGITEEFSTSSPISLYGASKLASEILALEYHYTFGFPVFINRCGVIAGAGQFGKIDQGIFSFWIYNWITNRPLAFIGFNGTGHQVRDFFCPDDLSRLILLQIASPDKKVSKIMNVGGGLDNSMSLQELNNYCQDRFGFVKEVSVTSTNRKFDIPFYVTDNSLVESKWGWKPEVNKIQILNGICDWAIKNKVMIESGF